MPSLPARIDRFEIKRLLGRGGMGELYLAHDPHTNRLVAIKVLSATEDSAEFRARFAREARALAALNHRNIVQIFDVGDFEGSPFIVMEYVRGETIEAMIRRRAPLSISSKLTLIMELCAGLAEAHGEGIVHRDVKPANLIVDEQGHLRILDFGIARVVNENRTAGAVTLTQVNVALGTPGYMAPEQIQGRPIDHRADIFASGAVAYELLAYRPAFAGSSVEQIERSVLAGAPPPLTTLLPDLDPEIDRVVLRALSSNPDERFQDARSFEQALGHLAERMPRPEATAVGAPGEAAPASLSPARTEIAGPVSQAATPQAAGRRWRSVRAEAAYRRALDAERSGALDAARRFAAEAVAEDPSFADARELLARLSARPARSTASALPPTIAASSFGDPGGPASVSPQGGPAAPTIISPWAAGPDTVGGSAPTIIVDSLEASAPVGSDTVALERAPQQTPQKSVLERLTRGVRKQEGPPPQDAPFWMRHTALVLVAGLFVMAALSASLLFFWLKWRPSGPVLTLERPVNGTLSGPGFECGTNKNDCVLSRSSDEVVELTATPDEGYALDHYTGACAPGGTVRMTGPLTCGAVFVAVGAGAEGQPGSAGADTDQVLTIAPVPTGGSIKGVSIDCGTSGAVCSGKYPGDFDEQLRPMPDENFTFMGFTGDCSTEGRVKLSGPRTCSAKFVRTEIAATTTAPVVIPRAGGGGARPGTRGGDQPAAGPTGGAAAGTTTAGGATGGVVASPPPPAPGAGGTAAMPGAGDGPVVQGPTSKEPPPPPETDEEFAKRKIKEMLARWCQAYEEISPEQVQQVFPSTDVEKLREVLNTNKYISIQCTVSEPKYQSFDPTAGKATFQVDLKRVYQHTILTKKKQEDELVATVTAIRPDVRSQWRIASATYKPKK